MDGAPSTDASVTCPLRGRERHLTTLWCGWSAVYGRLSYLPAPRARWPDAMALATAAALPLYGEELRYKRHGQTTKLRYKRHGLTTYLSHYYIEYLTAVRKCKKLQIFFN